MKINKTSGIVHIKIHGLPLLYLRHGNADKREFFTDEIPANEAARRCTGTRLEEQNRLRTVTNHHLPTFVSSPVTQFYRNGAAEDSSTERRFRNLF